jgi:hypothetical protein
MRNTKTNAEIVAELAAIRELLRGQAPRPLTVEEAAEVADK